ncbi:MAG: TraB/GumN family protein [Spirochaetaceae bacterium]|jgi:pheromone shutdown-related protein TraB|nr:TraB/GumN family protein [Spirochaetaceae bacterium]
MFDNSETRLTFKYKDKEILLLGTAHVSKESVEEAASVVKDEQPGLVCIELDKARYEALTQKDNWEKLDIIKVIREGKGFFLLANLVLAGFQRRLGNETGVKPGEEMRAAIKAAEECNIPYKLCDRELHITLRRAWESCSLWSKCKLLTSLFASAFGGEDLSSAELENLKHKNELDGMMAELTAYLPSVKKTLIDERDHYLAAKIWEGSREKNAQRVVAIVGAGHLAGIRACLEEIAEYENEPSSQAPSPLAGIADLETIPAPGWIIRTLAWVIPALIIALIVLGFVHSGVNAGIASIIRWVLWNGSLAALGALVALGHPLAVLTSFVGAPIGTLSPVISVGLLAGIVQASVRRPRVADAVNLNADAASLKGIYKNRITRTLLVFFLSSIGGVIGNFISIPGLFKALI